MLELNATALFFALSFLVFIFLLDKVLWKPVQKVKEERDQALQAELGNATQAEAKTRSIVQSVSDEVESIKKSEHDAIEQIFAESKQQEEKEESKLKAELEIFKQKAYEQFVSEEASLNLSVDSEAGQLAQSIIKKIAPELNISEGVAV
jgi:F-type H+-transporting ATPase subunit b